MATTASQQPFPIYYNQDVHGFYLKQKTEFHFNQKSDNDFLMFLLDTAVRVISIGMLGHEDWGAWGVAIFFVLSYIEERGRPTSFWILIKN